MPRPNDAPSGPPDREVDATGLAWRLEADGDVVRHFAYSATWSPTPELVEEWQGDPPVLIAEVTGSRVRSIRTFYSPATSKLWWVEMPETSASPPAFVLVAFDDKAAAPGSVVDGSGFSSLRVPGTRQAGAFRWWPGTGEVHQIYVAPHRRRQGIGTALITAAWTYARLRGWAPLWGTGQRTDLGEAWIVRGSPKIRARAPRRTHVLPPMTPAERAEGLDRRLLEPDL